MKKNQMARKKEEGDTPSAEEMLKSIIKKKETETEALKKMIDSLEKKHNSKK